MAVDDLPPLPPVGHQVERLAGLGLDVAADPSAHRLPDLPGALVAIRPGAVPVAGLAALLRRGDRSGFVVEDMRDIEEFVPTPETPIPDSPLYLVSGVTRGDGLRGRSPAEAQPALVAAGRSPLTVHEGLAWLLQQPEALADNHCFMTIASRRRTLRGYDARTPAIWISRGTGRDGTERRDAPKVGWCWWNNRHTWLGFASCTDRVAAAAAPS